ncbi:type II toxin-antitoxin system VapC family toxin [Methylococcus sp. ANG]|uniref:type II toxin-antitoxin system VapC family toxin n=1 Tax=Methylococcus sp. ANG TaxID=3231903 RepID=UPI003457BB6D
MIAFDTNLLVRALVVDNPDQVAVIRQLIASDTIFISRTVLLETEWVLRSRYKKTRRQLTAFFTALLEIDGTVVEDAEAISHALDWYAKGADFADALHLAVCGNAVLHTFDRDFCKAAREAGIAPEVRVWEV